MHAVPEIVVQAPSDHLQAAVVAHQQLRVADDATTEALPRPGRATGGRLDGLPDGGVDSSGDCHGLATAVELHVERPDGRRTGAGPRGPGVGARRGLLTLPDRVVQADGQDVEHAVGVAEHDGLAADAAAEAGPGTPGAVRRPGCW